MASLEELSGKVKEICPFDERPAPLNEKPKKVVLLKLDYSGRIFRSDDFYMNKGLGIRVNRILAKPGTEFDVEDLPGVKLEIWEPIFHRSWNYDQKNKIYNNCYMVAIIVGCNASASSMDRKVDKLKAEAAFYVGEKNIIHIKPASTTHPTGKGNTNVSRFSVQRQIELLTMSKIYREDNSLEFKGCECYDSLEFKGCECHY